ncbi:MAG TPA: hypothetical protein VFS32_09930 [Candidatus Limnocylindrales bacterium]|nr:hypothetical protein [Candidatus Limnocylindrales bacterium]
MSARTSPSPEVERLRALTASAIAISILAAAAVAFTVSPAAGVVLLGAALVVGAAAILDGRSKVEPSGPPLVRVLPHELERARRHGHPLTLVRARPAAGLGVMDMAARIRMLDHAWLERGEVMLLLGETDRAGADRLVGRLTAEGLLSGPVVAAFPDDALTTGGLLARLAQGADVVHLAPSPEAPAPAPAVLASLDGDARTG